MKKIYSLLLFTAILFSGLFAAPVELYAQSEDDLNPIKISRGTTEYWYFLQFHRQASNGTVLTAGESGTKITQVLQDGRESQQWKIIGEWDNYQLVNKNGQIVTYLASGENGSLTDYFQTKTQEEGVTGSHFKFVPFTETNNGTDVIPGAWQLVYADAESVTYVNDRRPNTDPDTTNPLGTVCAYYYHSDSGNRLTFIPVGEPQLQTGSSLAFAEVLRGGGSKKLSLTVVTANLSTAIGVSITGEDATAFSAPATLSAAGGNLDVTFSPTEKRRYEATLTLTTTGLDPVTVALTGNADFDLPIQISDATDNWYYIQFTRQAGNGKVLTVREAAEMGDTIVQAQVKEGPGADYQLWKVTGDWDNYYLINKASGYSVTLDYSTVEPAANVYRTIEGDFGDPLAFVAFKDTTLSWQLLNTVEGKGGYLNDASGSGKYLARYGNKSDAGNEFTFIDPSVPAIITAPSWDAGTSYIGEAPKTQRLLVSTIGIPNGAVTAALSGTDADAFTLSATTLQSGDSLKLTYTPGHLRKQVAEVTLTAGSVTKTIALSGNGTGAPVFTPAGASNDDSYWYVIQFNRRNTKSWEWVELSDSKIMQTELLNDTLNVNRWFKFVGDPFDFTILGYDNKVARINPAGDASAGRYALFPEGNADKLTLSQTGTDALSIKNKDYANRYLNDNSGTQIGVYGTYDAGAPLLISEVPGKDYPVSSEVLERAPKPYFSNSEKSYYYVIQFERTANKADFSNFVWTYTSLDSIAQQAVDADTISTSQWWKFVGDEESFKIVNYNGSELAYDSILTDELPRGYVVKAAGEGNTHSLFRDSKWVYWSIRNLEAWEPENGDTDNNVINDFKGTATALGLYADSDAGNPLIFTLVPGQTFDPIPSVEVAVGKVIAVKYYNLQGIEVTRPSVSGVYIVREILDSGQSRARKAIYIERR